MLIVLIAIFCQAQHLLEFLTIDHEHEPLVLFLKEAFSLKFLIFFSRFHFVIH